MKELGSGLVKKQNIPKVKKENIKKENIPFDNPNSVKRSVKIILKLKSYLSGSTYLRQEKQMQTCIYKYRKY